MGERIQRSYRHGLADHGPPYRERVTQEQQATVSWCLCPHKWRGRGLLVMQSCKLGFDGKDDVKVSPRPLEVQTAQTQMPNRLELLLR